MAADQRTNARKSNVFEKTTCESSMLNQNINTITKNSTSLLENLPEGTSKADIVKIERLQSEKLQAIAIDSLWRKYVDEKKRERLIKSCDDDEFVYGANYSVVGKTDHNKVSGIGAFSDARGTMRDLAAHHSAGHPWMPALLDYNSKRTQDNANYAQVWALDIDGGLSIEDARQLPFVKSCCGLGIESSSSTPQLNKFRLVFRAAPGESAQSSEEIRAVYLYLQAHVDAADKACKDASRFFFGGKGRKPFLIDIDKTLPKGFITRSIEWKEKEDAAKEAAIEERRKRNAYFAENTDADDQLKAVVGAIAALPRYTPGNNTYDLLIAAIAGVCNEYGSQADSLLSAWGEAGQWGKSWSAKLKSVRHLESNYSLGSLFKAAKELGGYQRPKKAKKPAITTTTSVGEKPSTKGERSTFKKATKKKLSTKKAEKEAARAAKKAERQANAAKWVPTLINATEIDERYFGDRIVRALHPGVLGFCGPTGTGKTTAYGYVIRWAINNGYQIIYSTQSESQALEFADQYKEAGLEYRKELVDIATGTSFVCCNAAVRMDAKAINWDAVISEKSIFLADEFASIADDLIQGEDAKATSKRAWEIVLQRSKVFVTGDANLKQEHIDLLHEISGRKRTSAFAIRKTSKPRNIVLWADSEAENTPKNAGDYTAHLLANALRQGKKSFVVTNSQQGSSAFSTTVFERYAASQFKIDSYRADGETGHYEDNDAFAGHQDYNERLNRYQLALISPANAVGKNYAPENLGASFVFDSGANTVEQDVQFAGRDRSDCDLNIYIGGGISQVRLGGSTDPVEIFEKLTAQLSTKEARKLSALISVDGEPETIADSFEAADPWTRFQCIRTAQHNAAVADKLGNIARYFKAIGHTVRFGAVDDSSEFKADRATLRKVRREATDEWNDSIAESKHLTRDEAKKVREGRIYTKDADRSLRKRTLVESNHTEEREYFCPTTNKVIELEKPVDHAKWDGTLVHQLSKLRDGGRWWKYYMFMHEGPLSWAAHAYRKAKTLDGLSASALRNLPLQIFPKLQEFGFKRFIEKFVISGVKSSEIAEVLENELAGDKANQNKLNTLIHQEYKEKRFNAKTPEMAAILERLNTGTQFEELCNIVGVSSQRSDDGSVKVAQVLTIIRQLFGLNTHYSSHMCNGLKAAYILSCDEKLGALNKAFRKAAKVPHSARIDELQSNGSFDSLDRAMRYHQREELFGVWKQQCEMNVHILNNAPHNALERLTADSSLFEEENILLTLNNDENSETLKKQALQAEYPYAGQLIAGFIGRWFKRGDGEKEWICSDGQIYEPVPEKYFKKIA